MSEPRTVRWAVGLATAGLFTLATAVAALRDADVAASVEREGPALHQLGRVVSWLGLSGYMLVAAAATAALAFVLMRRARHDEARARLRLRAERAAFVFSAVAASGLACQTIKHLVGRARPRFFPEWGAFHFGGPNFHAGQDSFPSGHATSAFALAVALGLVRPAWRAPLLGLALLVCAARVLAGAHFPSDTVAGAFLGTAMALALARAFAARDLAFPAAPVPRSRPAAPEETAAP